MVSAFEIMKQKWTIVHSPFTEIYYDQLNSFLQF